MAHNKTENASKGYKQIFDDAKQATLKACEMLAGEPAKEAELIRAAVPTSSIQAMRQFNQKEITEAELIAVYFKGLATHRNG